MKKSAFITILFLFSAKLYAQTMHTHTVFWGRIVLADRINDKFKWELYLQKRTQNASTGSFFAAPHFFSVWPWLSYKLSTNTKVSLSPIAYFNSHVFYDNLDEVKPQGVDELRVSGRLENEQKLRLFNYSNRYSLEYRMRDLKYNGHYQPNWRARYMFKLEKPFYNLFPNKKPISVYASDEVFIQFGSAVRKNPNVFDQNRINIGVSYEVVNNVKVNVSYLNIMQQRISGQDFDDAHTLWLILTFDNLFSQFKKNL